jgi:ABC-type uncharacterized transport system substrate-binding protein
VRRRDLLAMPGAAAMLRLLSAPAHASERLPLIGVLLAQTLDPTLPRLTEKLREAGYRDGRDMRLVTRSAEGTLSRLPGLAAELAGMKPSVIVAINTPTTRAAIAATREIPIVMHAGDPIGSGFVDNLAHPGGNVTGVSTLGGELAAKRLQLLKETIPAARRIAALYNPNDPVTAPQSRETERAAPGVGVDVRFFAVPSSDRLTEALRELADWHAEALLWLVGQERVFIEPTIAFAAKQRLPTMVPRQAQVEAGGLISYWPDSAEVAHLMAMYVGKILKGAKPGDLPVQQPTKYKLVINLKTAKALGLIVPQAIIARADEVIE